MSKSINIEELDWKDNAVEGGFDLKQFLNKARVNWLFILVSLILGGLIASLYLYVSNPAYKTTAKVLIKEDDPLKSGSAKAGVDMLQNLGLSTGTTNVDNELEILKSFTIMRQALQNLGLYVSLSKAENKLKSEEFYGSQSPYLITPRITGEKEYARLVEGIYSFSVINNQVVIEDLESGQKFSGALGTVLNLPGLQLLVSRNNAVQPWGSKAEAYIHFYMLDQLTDNYLETVNAEIPNKQVSVINLYLEGAIPSRSEDLLNQVIQIYIRNGVADRNAISDSTIAFIDARLAGVTTDLQTLEAEIQSFKQRNEIVDISAQSQALLSNAGDFYKTAAAQEVQLSVVNSLIGFMQQTAKTPRLVPASLTVDNPALSPMIAEYNGILLKRQRNLLSMTEENPVIVNIDEQLSEQRNNLLNGLYNMRNAAQSGLASIKNNNRSIDAQLKTVPGKEREFLEYSRQQAIKQELYLFLLQKREEAALSKSSTLSNARIIDAPRTSPLPVKPKRKLVLALGLLAGLIFPFGWLWLHDMMNTRIRSKKEIEQKTTVPIVGEIGHFQSGMENDLVVTQQNGRHPVVEQFRMLRSNLSYTLVNAGKVILVTSTMPGEGKTFISLNLAATFALMGKKTVIVGMDLRKPKLNKALKMTAAKGITHYLVGEASLQEIIHPVPGFSDLKAIVNGVIPPNPAELLLSAKCQELIKTLEQQFDYVIIDTAPVLVTDASILSVHAAITLYISRVDYTHKQSIEDLDKMQKSGRMGKLNLVVNDIKPKRYGGSYYGYSYGYGYGYGYGDYGQDKGTAHRRKSWQFWKR